MTEIFPGNCVENKALTGKKKFRKGKRKVFLK
jgi:hypothetical protein